MNVDATNSETDKHPPSRLHNCRCSNERKIENQYFLINRHRFISTFAKRTKQKFMKFSHGIKAWRET